MAKVNEISVFFPAYNEEANIADTVNKALTILPTVAERYEVIVVNDGSRDNTRSIVENLAKTNSHVRLVNHDENLGYGSALRSGFYNAKFDPIVFTDADGQFDLSEITKLLEAQSQADMVIGYRIKRMDPPMRLLNAWGWKQLIRLFLGLKIRDIDCAFKLVKQKVIHDIPKLDSTRGGTISPELMAKATRSGFTFVEVGVNHYPRKAGSPTGASPKVIMTSLIELVKLWWKLRSMPRQKTQTITVDKMP